MILHDFHIIINVIIFIVRIFHGSFKFRTLDKFWRISFTFTDLEVKNVVVNIKISGLLRKLLGYNFISLSECICFHFIIPITYFHLGHSELQIQYCFEKNHELTRISYRQMFWICRSRKSYWRLRIADYPSETSEGFCWPPPPCFSTPLAAEFFKIFAEYTGKCRG